MEQIYPRLARRKFGGGIHSYVCMYVRICMYSSCRVCEARVLIVVAIVVIVIVVMMAVEETKIGVIASVTIAVGLSRELEF